MKRRILAASAVAVLLALFYACAKRGRTVDKQNVLTARVAEGPMTISVRGTGEIRAIKESKIIPQIRRSAEITFLVPEGTRVKKGQVIARFNTDEIDQQLLDLEGRLTDDQTKLDAAETYLQIQNLDNETNLKTALQEAQSAGMQLDKFLQGDEPMSRRQAELAVTTAESVLTISRRRYSEMPDLLKEGFITEDQVEEERMLLESAQVNLDTDKIELRLLNEYTIPIQRAQAEHSLAKADTELTKTQKRNETLLRNKTRDLEAAKRRLARTEYELARVREDLKGYQVVAPTDGVVTYGSPDRWWRRGDIQVGASVHRGQVLMTIPDMSAMQAVINIPEAHVQYVREGQSATIIVEAVANKTFNGTTTKVAEVANEKSRWGGSLDVKEFRVDIQIQDADGLRPGFSCETEIITEVIPSALHVPVQAVFQEDDTFYVYPADGSDERIEVRIGKSSSAHVQILEGVNKDTLVFLTHPAQEDSL